eukprot:1156895-Pelagomonas_calceolata.AAC.3
MEPDSPIQTYPHAGSQSNSTPSTQVVPSSQPRSTFCYRHEHTGRRFRRDHDTLSSPTVYIPTQLTFLHKKCVLSLRE